MRTSQRRRRVSLATASGPRAVATTALAVLVSASGLTAANAAIVPGTPIGDLWMCVNNSTRVISLAWSGTTCPSGSTKYVVYASTGGAAGSAFDIVTRFLKQGLRILAFLGLATIFLL